MGARKDAEMAGSNFERVGRVSVPQTSAGEDRRAGVRAGLAQVKNGQTVPAEEVEAWIESLDTPEERPMPEPRRR
jgi:predicted transcriptional regulator